MLDSIRKRSNSLVSVFIIVVTAAVMALWGVDKMNNQGSQAPDAPVAWVNGERITRRELMVEYEYKIARYRQMLGGQFDEKLLAMLNEPQRTLEDMISAKLLLQQATQMGVRVSDNELADFIRSIPYYQKNGKFDAKLYSQLPNRGTEEKKQRERLVLNKFQTYLSDRIRLSPPLLKKATELKETKVDLDIARIDFNTIAPNSKPTAAAIEAATKELNSTEIEKYYEAHRGEFHKNASVKLHQIRAAIPFQASEQKKKEAKQKIEGIAKNVSVANFAEVAKKDSDDEHAKKGGEVGWVTRGTLEPTLESALDKLEVGKVSPVVASPMGYFILMITEKKEAVTQPLNEVKPIIVEKLIQEKEKAKFSEQRTKEWNAMLASGKSLDGELKKWKVDVKKTGPFSLAGNYIPNVGEAEPVMDAVFNLSEKSPLPPKLIEHQDAVYYVKLRQVERPKTDAKSTAENTERGVEAGFQNELVTQWIAGLKKKATVKTEVNFAAAANTEQATE